MVVAQHNSLLWDVPGEPVNVLLLDDDPSLLDVCEKALTRAGFTVKTAREGSEGLQALLSNRCDVVVSDLMMEPMDGITFLTEALKIWPWLGVIVFSGYMQEAIYRQAQDLGVRVILEKPLSFELLIRSVIDEAHRMRKRVSGQGALTLSRVLYQLNVLRDNTRTAIEAPSMEQALLNLCRDLGLALPSVLTAIMSKPSNAEERPVFAASLRSPIPPSFLPCIKEMIKERYTLLSGAALPSPDESEWVLCGVDPDSHIAAPRSEPLYFPIIRGNKITGLLLCIAPDDFACSESDISFLYHAANHFTTVITAFHRIRELAVRDELTGLYNRRYLQDELVGLWQMASRYDLNPALLIMDIDHFKLINDNYGHAAGDEVMRTLANIMQQACRSSDMIARYGGDEIIAVLPESDRDSVQTVAARMQNDIREHVFSPQKHVLHITVSIGVASFRTAAGDLVSSDAVLAHADEALYTAKRNGRNRTVVWMDPDAQSGASQAADSENIAIRTTIPSIIVVDDEPTVLDIIKHILVSENMAVQTFQNAHEALDAVAANPLMFDIALIDLHLAEMSGLELARSMHNESPFLVPIIITGDATLDNAVSSLRHGAYDFIPKPLQREHVKISLKRALEYHRLRLENEEYQQNLEAMVKRKSSQLTSALKRTRDAFDFTLRAMTDMLDAREHTTGEHSVRVQGLTVLLARKFNFSDKEIDGIRTGALLHDIGKIAVPDSILLKEGSLTEEESMIMRNHVELGYELIKTNADLSAASDIMLYHHENFDGSGYPRGLKGAEIPHGARIFSVVDAYDAMRSDRPYRESLSRENAIAELQKNSGTQFDPNVVEQFLLHIDEIEATGGWN